MNCDYSLYFFIEWLREDFCHRHAIVFEFGSFHHFQLCDTISLFRFYNFSLFDRVRITLCNKMFQSGIDSHRRNGKKVSITKPESDAKAYSQFFFSLCFFFCWNIFSLLFVYLVFDGRQYHGVFAMQIVLHSMSSGNKAIYEYRNSFLEASNHRKGKSTSFASFQYTRMSVEKVRKIQKHFRRFLNNIASWYISINID